ncbi:MAG: hypothetical protein A2007_06030 [Verrucomicrobia bacterium GWC2_42_7]|nr:MAG: hypothetical protein A2007_06030 [Verrucomicrobia bacterium GWC2_42_7]
MYFYGYGVDRDTARGFGYLFHSAYSGHTSAKAALSDIYLDGDTYLGIEKNLEVAEKYAKEIITSDGEDWWATKRLAQIAEERGDEKRFFEYAQKSANFGNRIHQRNLGEIYQDGRCEIAKDLEKSKYWYTLAANQGDEKARELLDGLNK